MAIKLAAVVRDEMLQAIEDYIGTTATLKICTGAPGTIGDVSSGTLLASISLPADWMQPASGDGVYEMVGTWEDTSANDTGDAGHFEIFKGGVNAVLMNGTVTATDGGGDMELTAIGIVAGQKVAVTKFNLTAGNG